MNYLNCFHFITKLNLTFKMIEKVIGYIHTHICTCLCACGYTCEGPCAHEHRGQPQTLPTLLFERVPHCLELILFRYGYLARELQGLPASVSWHWAHKFVLPHSDF